MSKHRRELLRKALPIQKMGGGGKNFPAENVHRTKEPNR